MVELIYLNASQHIDKATEHHPHIFHANRHHWFQLALKSPRLQQFLHNFNDQLNSFMQSELTKNKDNFNLFMLHPRPEKANICNLYPKQMMEDQKMKKLE